MNNKRRRAMARQRRAMAEYEDWLESRKPPEKLVKISEIIQKYEHHDETEEDDSSVIYTVIFNNNTESHKAIRELRKLGCECHNESKEWEDYDGQDTMWSVCWDYNTIHGE